MRVVNVRAAELRKAGFPSLVAWLAADARHVYVGRRCAYVKGAEADAPLHNPFSAAALGREGCVARFMEHALRSPTLLAAIDALPPDAVLGCWCAPAACHGDAICAIHAARRAAAASA
jgi:hypothetical protein